MSALLPSIRGPLWGVAGLSLLVNLLLVAPALFMLQVFDRVLASRSQETLLLLLLGVGLAIAFVFALDVLRGRIQGVLGNLVADELSPRVTRAMLAGAARRGTASGEGLRDVAAVRNVFGSQGLLALMDVPWAPIYIAVIWLAHPWLGVAAFVSALVLLGLAWLNDRVTRAGIEAVQVRAAEATRSLETSLHGAEVVQTLGMAPAVLARWRQLNAACAQVQRRLARRSVALSGASRALRQAVQVLLPALGATLVITGEGTPGILVATTLLLGRALSPIDQLVGSWRVLAEGRLAAGRIAALLAPTEAGAPRMELPPPTGRLEAHDLLVRSPQGDRLLLAGVSLRLAAGESLAIIGPSGAGKSTLVRLLTGLWQPTSGVVRLDQADLAQWPREALGPWLGYVPQDVELFAGTVAENIARLGPPEAVQVVAAARRAGVHEMVLSLPQGYDTVLLPGGAPLSPGQRQRIALARALYGAPKLLVLDEPNANLDGDGELALEASLRALHGEITVVVVTHRVALVRHVDKMLVLANGRAQHFGAREDVLRQLRTADDKVTPLPRPAAPPRQVALEQPARSAS